MQWTPAKTFRFVEQQPKNLGIVFPVRPHKRKVFIVFKESHHFSRGRTVAVKNFKVVNVSRSDPHSLAVEQDNLTTIYMEDWFMFWLWRSPNKNPKTLVFIVIFILEIPTM